MSLAGRAVVVVGAGIGGLAAARALALRGADVTVLERAPGIGEVGAGLQLSPNGLAVLDALGLGTAIRARSVAARAVVLIDGATGRPVLRLDLARHARGREWLFLHRARLVEVLQSGAREAGVRFEFDATITRIADGTDAATLTLEGRGQRRTPLVVAADGVRGVGRQALGGAEPPGFSGQVAWRATVPGHAPPEARVHMGPGRHAVVYPLAGGRVNLVAVEERSRWAEESWSAEDRPETLRAAFAGFAPDLRGLLDRVERVNLWGLFRHPVTPRWHGHRVVLLGDAAHPTLPFLAQGANLALEDAWALADCLDGATALSDALAVYQSRRWARAARVVAAATANARNYHLRPGPARTLSHAGLRLAGRLAPGAALARFNWIYDHDETRAARR